MIGRIFEYCIVIYSHIFVSLKMFIISSTVITLITLVIVGIYQENYTMSYINVEQSDKTTPELQDEDEEAKKLYLVTKFNTLVNKMMPENLYEYVKCTYDKIYGEASVKYYPQILRIGNGRNEHTKRKRKVYFAENLEEVDTLV